MHTDFLVPGSRDRYDERPALLRNRVRSAGRSAEIAERTSVPGRRAS